ncbi:hypothetical protein [Treponema sp. Marseille-Q4132]|uniref:hypothetical protein n=1 Tax=Treponema sp. Marseille-Q4132 TaxID=2766701 RepID=UPI001653133C|nr:hypothetical protein [Treponema sp. Marseille-Q4132]QNL97154.1 hypothetical protein H9I35_12210 [Treponema sp. Marseille-Q4132]
MYFSDVLCGVINDGNLKAHALSIAEFFFSGNSATFENIRRIRYAASLQVCLIQGFSMKIYIPQKITVTVKKIGCTPGSSPAVRRD